MYNELFIKYIFLIRKQSSAATISQIKTAVTDKDTHGYIILQQF